MKQIAQILDGFDGMGRDDLIPILQAVQDVCGFLSDDAIVEVARFLELPAAKVYGVATFYDQFRFEPTGRFVVQVCQGTACHVKGGKRVLKSLERALGIHNGETTKDHRFTLETVPCSGICAGAPVVRVGTRFFTHVQPDDVMSILSACQGKENGEGLHA